MPATTRALARLAIALACAAAFAGPALAQETVAAGGRSPSAVTVVKDRATVWTRNPSMVLAVVPEGTVLRAISRDDKWYEVEVPEALAAQPGGARGFILAAQVALAPGAPEPPVHAAKRETSRWEPVGPGGGAEAVATPKSAAKPGPGLGIRGFGMLDYMSFAAKDSFNAILGGSSYPLFGGGVDVVIGRRILASVSASRFRKTGQRVFVSGTDVFKLGIDDTVTITPISFTGAYRLHPFDHVVPYVGGGVGIYRFQEESEFAEAGENVDERFTSYHVLGGAEYAVTRWLFTAFEAQYTTVPDSLGAPGVSAEFGEKNLGGFSFRVKVSVGR
jgi:opacity protein-like surface antigen